MIWWIAFAVLYVGIACFMFHSLRKLKQDLLQRKHYARHPERVEQEFGGIVSDIVCAILWPLQIIGVFMFIFRS